MLNNIWFKIIAGKNNKIPEFYTIFARKMPDYIIRQRGQAEAKTSRLRPKLRGRGRNFGLKDLTSLLVIQIALNLTSPCYSNKTCKSFLLSFT